VKYLSLLFVFCCTSPAVLAVDKPTDLTAGTNSRLEGKLVTLKKFYQADQLNFDAQGSLLGKAQVGPWTLFSKLRINSAQVRDGALQLEATRLVVRFNAKGEAELLPLARTVKLQIAVPEPTSEKISAAMDHIFLSEHEQFSDFVPDYWRDAIKTMEAAGASTFSSSAALDANADARNIRAPRPLHTTEVEYTDAALRESFEGQLQLLANIGKDGHVESVGVLHPAGLGLDDEAVSEVRKWIFKPATRDGKPVPVPLQVELGFKLTVIE
jgi:TonB family protein